MASRFLLAVGLVASIGAAGCARKDEAGKASSIPPLPPGTPAAPPAAAPAPAAAAAAPAAPAANDPGATITGQLVIPAALAKSRPAGTLYLVARRTSDNPSARGTLIAVKKLPADTFPLPFTLGAADMPFQNGPFDGELVLTARIDQDGDPITHQKGDLFGTLPKVRVGSHDVKLSLDQLQKEAESLAQPGPMGAPSGAPMGGAHLPPGHPL